MKKRIVIAAVISSIVIAFAAVAADAVQPQTLDGLKLYRDVVSTEYSTNTHYTQSSSFLFTNIVCYSTANLGVTNSVLQGLDSVTVQVALSTSSSTTGTWQSATVQVATNGTWYCALTNIPAASIVYWQCRITDVNTNTYYYRQQMLYADPHL